MLYSNRTLYTKKQSLLTHISVNNRKHKHFNNTNKLSVRALQSIQNSEQVQYLRETIREQEVKMMQLRNQLLKRQIQTKEKAQRNKDIEKQLQILRKQKQGYHKAKLRFENQRKCNHQKIQTLESYIQQIKARLENTQKPKDRYQTCLRQLDQLKNNIQYKQDLTKQRDFYKYFYEEIRSLVVQSHYSSDQIKNSLLTLFLQMDEKNNRNK